MDPAALKHELETCPTAKQWQQVGIEHHHGINIPLFCLHSSFSSGIGEYTDLIPLLPWCKKVGFDVIQLLPINDTGLETSPYNAFSAMALNPLHLGLRFLPGVEHNLELCLELEKFKTMQRDNRIDYESLIPARERWLQKYLDIYSEELKLLPSFEDFCKENLWLESYALFKALKLAHNWACCDEWPSRERWPNEEDYQNLLKEHSKNIFYNSLIQFLCFQQMHEVKVEADALDIKIKGDIPILIGIESADVWRHPDLFHTDYRAGAPPDIYNSDGQSWGFPIYNWQRLQETDYFWWKERLSVAEKLYQIYRIDHIVGFFRIWAITPGSTAKNGFFEPRDAEKWIPQGTQILRALIHTTDMLPIGEDLGIVTDDIKRTLKELGICSTKVMRWERAWNHNGDFIPPSLYSPLSMTTVSTHDSGSLTLWWRNFSEEAREYCRQRNWHYSSEITSEQLKSILYDCHHSTSLFHINLINEYLSLVPTLRWENPDEDRINLPGIVSPDNWSYRIKPSVEELVASLELQQVIREVLS